MDLKAHQVSIIIPARNAMATIDGTLESVLSLPEYDNSEVIVVNDALDKNVAQLAKRYPVKVVNGNDRGLAAARNIGVRHACGKVLIFLDADCQPLSGWLISHIQTHKQYGGLLAVGGSFCLKSDAKFWARCDHYCSWYDVNPGRLEDWVPNHPGGNFSITKFAFEQVGPFREDLPSSGVHEDIEWQIRFRRLGGRIRFEPTAAVWHLDRENLKGYLKHNYQWGYNSLLVKGGTDVSRFPCVYRHPRIISICFLPFALTHTLYTIGCWLRVGKIEPLYLSPFIFLGRLFYSTGMVAGTCHTPKNQKLKIN
jgi:glycosyltransferase involved in cell wall biosynthesis